MKLSDILGPTETVFADLPYFGAKFHDPYQTSLDMRVTPIVDSERKRNRIIE